ncbi:uncharacterized protein BJ212DRAFT_398161 [Suillus subaureus]|uniref:Uncharacterized protein n=1 Tax=Suillus subaureus TaxID=48587 RepID=A0A9P7DMB3_9AGAM|nr:uncharacterized protein BJ212DRAFT_245200 [Suillus subaureus]XP_041191335.1 uncharacterized protein BJ212DRAFT_398161 [Suillus subaureus]KAG1798290.1 hypothetical protein BJ212DRAFT_245200 [Suillus subaureus]KAG1813574.1 hypothetical protein BJ212DRAFT_398161 [Suillus subaureus]
MWSNPDQATCRRYEQSAFKSIINLTSRVSLRCATWDFLSQITRPQRTLGERRADSAFSSAYGLLLLFLLLTFTFRFSKQTQSHGNIPACEPLTSGNSIFIFLLCPGLSGRTYHWI